jgi:hypothetical protein
MMSISVPSRPPLPTLLTPGAGDPKRRPVAGLLLELGSGHVVAESVLELALCGDAAVRGLVAVHEGGDDEVAVAVEADRFAAPPTTLALAIWSIRPFRFVQPFAVKFVVPDQLERLPVGGWRKSIGGVAGSGSNGQ